MKRRHLLRALGAVTLPGTIAACGGGGTSQQPPPVSSISPKIDSLNSDKPGYFIGEPAKITAVFSGGSARLEPGAIPVTTGVEQVIGPLSRTAKYTLIVTSGQTEARREISLQASYRNVFSTIDMGFARALHQALALPDGRVLVLGGDGGGGAPPLGVMAFSPESRRFSLAGELLTGRTEHTATLLVDGTVLVVGGSRTVSGTAFAERFDPRSGTSRPTAGQPTDNRWQHSATLLADGKVLVAGGRTSAANANSDTADLYDPVSDQFTRLPMRLAVKRYGHAALRVTDNTVMIYGGASPSGQVAAPESFDVAARSSSALFPRTFDPGSRINAAVVKLADSDFLVLGGETQSDSAPLASVTAIASGGIAINPVLPMLTPRSQHAAATLADGRALITGGITPGQTPVSASSELYSLIPALVQPGPAMAFPRTSHTATALRNGMVLVVGGLNADGLPHSTAELYA